MLVDKITKLLASRPSFKGWEAENTSGGWTQAYLYPPSFTRPTFPDSLNGWWAGRVYSVYYDDEGFAARTLKSFAPIKNLPPVLEVRRISSLNQLLTLIQKHHFDSWTEFTIDQELEDG